MPPGVGDDGDGVVVDLHDLLDALHAGDLGFVVALQLAAEHRAGLDRGVEHARQLDVDAVDHLAGGLVDGVEPLERLPAIFQSFGSFSLTSVGGVELGGGFRHLAVGRGASRRRVRDDAVGGGAFRRRHLPARWPRPGSASCARWRRPCGHIRARCGCRGCRRCEKSPQTRLRATLCPGVGYSVVTFDQSHSSSSATSWARPVRVPWPISDRAMRITTVSSGWITTQALTSGEPSAARTVVGTEGNVEAEREAGADSGGADHEGAAVELRHMIHGCPLKRSRRRGSLRAPAGRCRNGRYW